MGYWEGCRLPVAAASTPATTTTASAPTAAASSTTAAASSTSTFAGWAGFVDHQGTAEKVLAVEGLDGLLSFFVVADLDECEGARLVGIAVADEVDSVHMDASLG